MIESESVGLIKEENLVKSEGKYEGKTVGWSKIVDNS